MSEGRKIDIASLTADNLKDAPIEELEALQTELSACMGVLRQKSLMVAQVLEQKEKAREVARKAGAMTDADKAAMRAHLAEEDRINGSDMSDDDKAAALAKLNHVPEKPATQHLTGSHITKDGPDVNPGT